MLRNLIKKPKVRMTEAEKYARSVLDGKTVAGKWIKLACQRFLDDLERDDLTLDVKQGQRAINFIERKLCHWEGTWRGQPLKLEDWQKFIVMQVFGWQKDGKRRIRSVYIQIARKNGKALALDTPIPTPNGWTTMGEIQVGDQVFDEFGLPCNVTYTSPVQLNRNCYKVKFSDGSEIIADEEHLWYTETKNTGLIKKGRPKHKWNLSYEEKIKTTKQIAETLYSGGSKGGKQENNHKIPVSGSIKTRFNPDLVIPPYTLGVWLGDGYSSSANFIISPKDKDILDGVIADGFQLTEKRYQEGSYTYRIHSGEKKNVPFYRFVGRLRTLKLVDNKHIPKEYLRASPEQRFELLRGLMDTDGTCEKHGQCSFTTTTHQLSLDFYELVCSLGFKATIRTRQPKLQDRKCALAYTICFFAYKDTPVFKLKRKFERQKPKPSQKTRLLYRHIVSVEPVPSVPVRCIEVDSEKHLYLAGRSFIPTHNTSFAAAVLLYHLFADKENTPQILVGANNEDQAKICVNSAGRILQQSPEFKEMVEDETVKLSIYGRNVIGIYHHERDGAVKAMSKNPETQDGFNPSIGIVDEYHEAKDDALLNVIESGQGARPEPLLFVVTTAGFDKQGPCYAKLRKGSVDMLAKKVTDDAHLAFIFELDEGDLWDDPTVWKKANPNLGVSLFPDYLKSRLTKAKNEGASKEVDFRTKNLNMWVDAPTVWIQDETWMKNMYGISMDELVGARCYGGLDLATGIDLNAFCLFFPKFKFVNDRWINPVLWWFWIPKTRVKSDDFDYTEWVDKGLVIPTEGVFENVIDHKKIITDICQLPKTYNIEAIAFDQRLAYHGVVQELGTVFGTSESDEWITGLYPFTQSFPNVSMCAKQFEKQATNFEFEHFGNPVARWMLGNVVIKKDAVGQIMPDKSKSSNKIDGIAALLNAIGIDIRISANGGIQTEAMAL